MACAFKETPATLACRTELFVMARAHGNLNSRRHTALAARCSSRVAGVVMVQPAHPRQSDHISAVHTRYLARYRRVLIQRKVSSRLVVVLQIVAQNALQVVLDQNDDMVNTTVANLRRMIAKGSGFLRFRGHRRRGQPPFKVAAEPQKTAERARAAASLRQ